jgi:biopolymer transport protein ExbB/TolQ
MMNTAVTGGVVVVAAIANLSGVNIASIVVAIIAALSAYASSRAASRASTLNTQTSSRIDMEREAYERARAFDVATIARQDLELAALRAENLDQRKQIDRLRTRVDHLEDELGRPGAKKKEEPNGGQ